MTSYVDGVELEGWGGGGGIWCTLALGLSGNNHRRRERDDLRPGGKENRMRGWGVEKVKVLPK